MRKHLIASAVLTVIALGVAGCGEGAKKSDEHRAGQPLDQGKYDGLAPMAAAVAQH